MFLTVESSPLEENQFAGSLSEVLSLQNLRVVLLKDNLFSGSLPSKLPKKLLTLEMRENLGEGEIPRSLCNNTDLEILETRPV